MQLYLVRHGEAVAGEIDPERPLSAQGVAAARKMAAFLKPRKIEVGAIWHSTKARALQTAEMLSKAVTSKRGLAERKKIGARSVGSKPRPQDGLVLPFTWGTEGLGDA